MTHRKMIKVPCTACKDAQPSEVRYCRECRGVGYTEHPGEICDGTEYYDPMCGGWECNKCGGSGPL